MHALTRRSLMAGFAASLAVRPGRAAAQSAAFAYCVAVENGMRNDRLAVGFLLCRRPAVHAAALASLRRRDPHYKRPLRYYKIDKFKVAFAKRAIDYFTRTPDLALVVAMARSSMRDLAPAVADAAHAHLYRAAQQPVRHLIATGSRVDIPLLANRARDRLVAQRVRNATAGLSIRQGTPAHPGLKELAAFLTGNVRAGQPLHDPEGSALKRDLRAYLAHKLQVPSLSPTSLRGPKIKLIIQ